MNIYNIFYLRHNCTKKNDKRKIKLMTNYSESNNNYE